MIVGGIIWVQVFKLPLLTSELCVLLCPLVLRMSNATESEVVQELAEFSFQEKSTIVALFALVICETRERLSRLP